MSQKQKLSLSNFKDNKDQLDKSINEVWEIVNPFEKKLELRKQYEEQVKIMEHYNILVELKDGQKGIIGINGKEYPIPSLGEISKRMLDTKENRELLKKKVEQGFTQLLVVPFGMSLDELIGK